MNILSIRQSWLLITFQLLWNVGIYMGKVWELAEPPPRRPLSLETFNEGFPNFCCSIKHGKINLINCHLNPLKLDHAELSNSTERQVFAQVCSIVQHLTPINRCHLYRGGGGNTGDAKKHPTISAGTMCFAWICVLLFIHSI